MLYHLLITIVIVFILMAFWFGVQFIERRFKNLPSDCDVLKDRKGCLGCLLRGHCTKTDSVDEPKGINTHSQ